MRHSTLHLLALLLIATLALAACRAPAPLSQPATKIDSPASNSTVTAGKELVVQSTSDDPRGIVQVDLLVDGLVVRSDQAPDGSQTSYTVIQKWTAAGEGSHTVSVEAVNKDKVVGNRASIAIDVVAVPTPARKTPTVAPTTAPTQAVTGTVAPTAAPTASPAATQPAPTATATAVPPSPVPCRNVATFLSETIPDGAQFQPGQPFSKSWTVRNDGNCPWNNAYRLIWTGGEQMSNVNAVVLPATAPGGAATLTIAMTAPVTPGSHAGQWQLRDPRGAAFTTAPVLTVNIVTVAPTPLPCIPVISSFSADQTTIHRGDSTTLRWGPVSSADGVQIDNGIGGVATPGSATVAPNQTTTYTLSANCGGNTRSAQVTVNVIQPQPTQAPQRVNLTGNWSAQGYMMELDEAIGCMQLPCGYRGRWIKVTQGAPEITEFTQGLLDSNRNLTITVPGSMPGQQPLYFNGTASEDGRTITGSWTRGSEGGQLTFSKQ
jgi:hypothetical protein